ncbi:uncharacterized protein UTRI_04021_B [Ustilago trichophora]|uniref:Uncharacterized protein n=1 Tax=Ustilago trichophora TaxID=86804 RepID=A0A5C3E7K1_9BASI|nr:uncharacterized protein UTRI_04021_B [Ustilago trichophora]
MSTTPSPSKRPRLPTSSAVPSATASPFASSSRPNGPRSVGPTGTSASAGPVLGLGMSPADAFSPAPEAYGMSGLTPYSTTSPAYASGGTAGITAASPISAALAHGSRILSNIQAGSPFYPQHNGTPMMQQQTYIPGGARYPPQAPHPTFGMPPQQQQQQLQQQTKPVVPQQGSPEYLKLALQHLQNTLLTRLESEAEAFFDATDSALAESADSRRVAGKATSFQAALSNVCTYLEKNGLASIPLLPIPDTSVTETKAVENAAEATASTAEPTKDAASTTIETTTTTAQDQGKNDSTKQNSGPTLEKDITSLQQQAKELFNRRQRLKESASIVSGILDS